MQLFRWSIPTPPEKRLEAYKFSLVDIPNTQEYTIYNLSPRVWVQNNTAYELMTVNLKKEISRTKYEASNEVVPFFVKVHCWLAASCLTLDHGGWLSESIYNATIALLYAAAAFLKCCMISYMINDMHRIVISTSTCLSINETGEAICIILPWKRSSS